MDECLACNSAIKTDEKQVKCVYCGNAYHMKCAGLSESRYNKIQKLNYYFCSTPCESSYENNKKMDELLATMKALQTSVDCINKKCEENGLNLKRSDDAMQNLSVSIRELSQSQSEIKCSVEEVKTSQMFISAQYEDIKSLHEEMKKDFASCCNKVDAHDNKITAIDKSIIDLKKRLRFAEQSGLKNEIVISGVPKELSLCEQTIVTKVAAAVGVQLFTTDIEKIQRIKNGMVLVEFCSSKVRNDILRARKGKSIFVDEIDFGNAVLPGNSRSSPNNKRYHSKVFINENLTRETRLILKEAKSLRATHGYKYVWCGKGNIYCKRDDSSEPHVIDSIEDLKKLRLSPKKA
ncbi:uncharacterized protein LOC128746004 [Sabethes cyaneus]|uniref:uncharacterized protein LOC128746004 n=1 Tax=Sabethes cyaneus TaxID=53552 RepID=UPI00237E270D|nr:uncharacterized protein LOC128746004 [Sabethes cyaneus]